jgi:hypothetical protein
MKIFPYAVILILLALATGVLAVGCQGMSGCCGHEHGPSAAPAPDAKAGAYTCPMHPEVKADKPGKCPKCGMDLVPVKDAK